MEKKKNIVLTGFMGTGKTTVGKILAKKLGMSFVDVDELIEKTAGLKISEVFARFGEAYFRDIETEIIKSITKNFSQVIATGGGAVLRDENLNALKSNGVVFCLTASEELIFDRIKDNNERPLLQVENPKEKIRELLAKRMPRYMMADFIINTDGLTQEEVSEKIIKEYERVVNGKS
jgi:shikimate kinase